MGLENKSVATHQDSDSTRSPFDDFCCFLFGGGSSGGGGGGSGWTAFLVLIILTALPYFFD